MTRNLELTQQWVSLSVYCKKENTNGWSSCKYTTETLSVLEIGRVNPLIIPEISFKTSSKLISFANQVNAIWQCDFVNLRHFVKLRLLSAIHCELMDSTFFKSQRFHKILTELGVFFYLFLCRKNLTRCWFSELINEKINNINFLFQIAKLLSDSDNYTIVPNSYWSNYNINKEKCGHMTVWCMFVKKIINQPWKEDWNQV